MVAKPNIFGVITYLKSAGNLDFCNFNLLDVKVCPGCGFASKAEFYMEENQQDKAESELRAAQKIANAIFEHLDGVPSLHVALLLFQIAIYFKELKDAGQIMRFTDNYNKDGRLAQGSDEYKAYVVTKNTVKKTYDDRELIDREKMTSFFLE